MTGGGRGMEVRGRRIVVVGAARSGVAAARLLASRGAQVVLADQRPAIEEEWTLQEAGIALELGPHRADSLLRADLVVLSPGVPPRQEFIERARREGVPVVGELELASRLVQGRIVAVTGTKGKSTTTTLIGRMLASGGVKALVGGNLGPAFSGQVEESTPETVHVIEASSFQLEATETFHANVAVFLNFSPDHLDRHATVEEYREAKRRIFANQEDADHAVVNADDPLVMEDARRTRARLVPFSLQRPVESGVSVIEGVVTWRGVHGEAVPLVPLTSVRLLGRHLLADVLAAAAVAHLFGVAPEAMQRAVEGFTGLEHALEPVAEIGSVRFVNDSKATNVEAARRAIESFGPGLAVIMGGRFKGGDLSSLRMALAERQAVVVAIGEARPLLQQAFRGSVRVIDAESMREAVGTAFASVGEGGVVLLAPACASFDMFRDYADRGRTFKEDVARLAAAVRDDAREQ